jgi:hypothetical protein
MEWWHNLPQRHKMRADDDLSLFLDELKYICMKYHFVIDEFMIYEIENDKLFLGEFRPIGKKFLAYIEDRTDGDEK